MKRLQVREYDCEMLMELSGWGRYPRAVNTVLVPTKGEDAVPPSVGRMIARGQGRSYGDAAMLRLDAIEPKCGTGVEISRFRCSCCTWGPISSRAVVGG